MTQLAGVVLGGGVVAVGVIVVVVAAAQKGVGVVEVERKTTVPTALPHETVYFPLPLPLVLVLLDYFQPPQPPLQLQQTVWAADNFLQKLKNWQQW